MKVMPMSAMEILPALLSKKKTQTIRPLWITGYKEYDHGYLRTKETLLKKPRFKVGGQIQIMWKQRSSPKGSWFCKECGMEMEHYKNEWIHRFKPCLENKKDGEVFQKIFGTVEITEVFEIEMEKQKHNLKGLFGIVLSSDYFTSTKINKNDKTQTEYLTWIDSKTTHEFNTRLAKKDGFKSAKDMFAYFDKEHDLSTPKRFAVYRWRWIT